MTCLVNPSLVELDLNSISGYLYRMRITLGGFGHPPQMQICKVSPILAVMWGHQVVAVASSKWLSTVQPFSLGRTMLNYSLECLFTCWTCVHDIWENSAHVTAKSNMQKLGNAKMWIFPPFCTFAL